MSIDWTKKITVADKAEEALERARSEARQRAREQARDALMADKAIPSTVKTLADRVRLIEIALGLVEPD